MIISALGSSDPLTTEEELGCVVRMPASGGRFVTCRHIILDKVLIDIDSDGSLRAASVLSLETMKRSCSWTMTATFNHL
jgi:hypothetical protein